MWKRVEDNPKIFKSLKSQVEARTAKQVLLREREVAKELDSMDSVWEVDHYWEHRAVNRKVRQLIEKIDSRPCHRSTGSAGAAAAAASKLKERNEKRARPYSVKHRRLLLEGLLAKERERHIEEVTKKRKEAAIRFRAVMDGGECTFTLEDARMVVSKGSSTRTIQQMVEDKINRKAVASAYCNGESQTDEHDDEYHNQDEGTPPHCQRRGRRGSVALRRKKKLSGPVHLQRGISRKSLWRQSRGISAIPMPFKLYSTSSTAQMLELIVQAMVAKADAHQHRLATPQKDGKRARQPALVNENE
jgi:hypothetical protein